MVDKVEASQERIMHVNLHRQVVGSNRVRPQNRLDHLPGKFDEILGGGEAE